MILDKKYEKFRQEVSEFAQKELKEKAKEIDRTGEFPLDTVEKLAQKVILVSLTQKKLVARAWII